MPTSSRVELPLALALRRVVAIWQQDPRASPAARYLVEEAARQHFGGNPRRAYEAMAAQNAQARRGVTERAGDRRRDPGLR